MNITIAIKSVYGNRTIYPVCSAAKVFAAIAGTKTLTQQSIGLIQSLGYTIVVQQETL